MKLSLQDVEAHLVTIGQDIESDAGKIAAMALLGHALHCLTVIATNIEAAVASQAQPAGQA